MSATQPQETAEGACTGPPVYDARDLVGPDGTAEIHLDGQRYALRITRADKLILTK
ncbi:MAG: hemin uptake protein HemP [Paracoccaceae bacterium]|nr:hemin uptake protein HemP [Paracoccaceae bacterium]